MILFILVAIPKIDSSKANIERFKNIIIDFLSSYSLGVKINLNVIFPMFCFLFFYIVIL